MPTRTWPVSTAMFALQDIDHHLKGPISFSRPFFMIMCPMKIFNLPCQICSKAFRVTM